MKMKAAVTNKQVLPIEIEEVNICEPRDFEVRVKMVSSGICHTDEAHAINEWNMEIPLPVILGHEGAGIVESIGPGVTKVKPGDHVIISDPGCGECDSCLNGMPWYCENEPNLNFIDFYGGSPITKDDGTPIGITFQQSSFAEYCVSHESTITKLPEDFDLKIAGPIGCGMRTGAGAVYSCIKPDYGKWMIITGAGTVGLSALWTAKAEGARVAITDINDLRLDLAKETGADFVLNVKGMTDDEITAALIEGMGGKKASYMAECTGVNLAIQGAMNAVTLGGRIAQVGVAGEMHFDSWFFGPVDSKTITFVRMGNTANDIIINVICDMYKNGKFPLDKMIKFFKFEEINEAIEEHMAGKIIKPVLLFD